jgi:hypothetical protein
MEEKNPPLSSVNGNGFVYGNTRCSLSANLFYNFGKAESAETCFK